MESLGMLFGSLAVKAVLIEVPEQLKLVQGRMNGRMKHNVRDGTIYVRLSRRHMQKIARLGNAARSAKVDAFRREAVARNAAKSALEQSCMMFAVRPL
jgi:hypothetical protein